MTKIRQLSSIIRHFSSTLAPQLLNVIIIQLYQFNYYLLRDESRRKALCIALHVHERGDIAWTLLGRGHQLRNAPFCKECMPKTVRHRHVLPGAPWGGRGGHGPQLGTVARGSADVRAE